MFLNDPFDIAPGHRRQRPASWAILAIGAVFCVVCGIHAARSFKTFQEARAATQDVKSALQAKRKRDELVRAQQAVAPVEATKAELALQHALVRSWSGIFGTLELATKAVAGRATITSIAPVRLRPEGTEINITALALSNDAMVQLLQALSFGPLTRDVQLLNQQPVNLSGRPAVRFQAVILLRSESNSPDQRHATAEPGALK